MLVRAYIRSYNSSLAYNRPYEKIRGYLCAEKLIKASQKRRALALNTTLGMILLKRSMRSKHISLVGCDDYRGDKYSGIGPDVHQSAG